MGLYWLLSKKLHVPDNQLCQCLKNRRKHFASKHSKMVGDAPRSTHKLKIYKFHLYVQYALDVFIYKVSTEQFCKKCFLDFSNFKFKLKTRSPGAWRSA